MSHGPPRILVRLLDRTLPGGVHGQSIIGDVTEEWHRRKGGFRRTLWFAAVAGGLALRYAAVRGGSVFSRGWAASIHAVGRALRHPLPTLLTVVVLGVGIAAPATMFSIVAGITRDVDVEDQERLVHIGRRFTPDVIGIAPLDWLWPSLQDLEGLEVVGIYQRDEADLHDGEGPATRLQIAFITPGVFRAFGVAPALGRAFGPGDATAGAASPLIVSRSLWRDRFGDDPSVLGRTVRVNGTPRVVVGVMPEGFQYPGGVDLWAPLDLDDPEQQEVAAYQAVGRLAPGSAVQGIIERVDGLNDRLRADGEEVHPAGGLAAEPWKHSLISARNRIMLSSMVLLMGLVLFIACVDVLNLLLARALARSRETAVRVALGAGRGRVVGEHLTEATVLSAMAGMVGLALTVLAVRVFDAQTAGALAHWMEIRVDLRVVAFGAGMVALAALGTGLAPALQSGRVDLASTLQEGGRGASAFRIGRVGRWLVGAQIAFSCLLLVVAGTMVRGAAAAMRTDGSFAAGELLAARYELRPDAYPADAVGEAHRRLLRELDANPEVEAAAVTSHLPGVFAARRRVEVEGSEAGRATEAPASALAAVSPGFLSTLGTRVIRGRDLTWEDGTGGPGTVLVNEAFARERLGDRDPLGTRIRLVGGQGAGQGPWLTVVGVVPALGIDVGRHFGGTGIYLPAAGDDARRASVLLRARPGTDPHALAAPLREAMARVDPDVALYDVDTLAGHIERNRAIGSIFAMLFSVFGLAGLLLAAVGLYGLMAFTVRRRMRELGIRVALGAAPVQVLRTALGGGLLQIGLGMTTGFALAALLGPLLGEALLGGDPRDPQVYGMVAAVLGFAGLLASLGPARRALGTDVVRTIRVE